MKQQKGRLYIPLAIAIISTLFMFLISKLGVVGVVIESAEGAMLNIRYVLRGSIFDKDMFSREGDFVAPQIAIVEIDEKSLEEMGRFQEWSRTYHGELVDSLRVIGAKSIAFDMIFSEASCYQMADDYFGQQVMQHGQVVQSIHYVQRLPEIIPPKYHEKYAYQFSPELINQLEENLKQKLTPSKSKLIFPQQDIALAAKSVGTVNLFPDQDGYIRHMPLFTVYQGKMYPSLAFELARLYLNVPKSDVKIHLGKHITLGNRHIPIDDQCQLLIHYPGNPRQVFSRYSYCDFRNGTLTSQNIDFSERAVFVGATAAGLYELRTTPVDKTMAGVFIHASIFQNIVQSSFLKSTNIGFVMLLTLIFAIIIALLSSYVRQLVLLIVVFIPIVLIVYSMVSIFSFSFGHYWIKTAQPMAAMILTFGLTMTYRYFSEEKEKNFIKTTFNHYLDARVVNKLMEHPEMLKLGGERKEITVLFADAANFTTISEDLDPEKLVNLLNLYLSQMTEVVFKYDGTLDKYQGDAVMAFWGAPTEQPNHALLACQAGLEMQNRITELHQKWNIEEIEPLSIRVGINTGLVIVGNMGSNTRFDYTVMGDPVNLAARLEPRNKDYHTKIMIGKNTYQAVKDQMETRILGKIKVKGKTIFVNVYELIGKKGDLDTPSQKEMKDVLRQYDIGYEAYQNEKWQDGLIAFENALTLNPDDGPSRFYLNQCKKHLEGAPSENERDSS